jgi:hypothetical protein
MKEEVEMPEGNAVTMPKVVPLGFYFILFNFFISILQLLFHSKLHHLTLLVLFSPK